MRKRAIEFLHDHPADGVTTSKVVELKRWWSVFPLKSSRRPMPPARLNREDTHMSLSGVFGRTGRTLAFASAIVGAIGLTVTPKPAQALGTGAAVGIGLGALAVGTALGAASSPYYGYPAYYYPPAPVYSGYGPAYYGYAPAPARSCWSPYYGHYYPC
jgi:hypothetical protein